MPKSLFKTKLFGFDKAAVAGYITKAEEKTSFDLEAYEQQIAALESENRILRKEAEERTAGTDEVQALTAMRNAIEEEKAKLSSELLRLQETLERTESDYASLKKEHEAMLARYESMSEMAKNYDKTCADAGSILALAKSKADEITSDAETEAAVILAGAKKEADACLIKARADADAYAIKLRAESETLVEKNREKLEYLIRRQKQLLSTLQLHKSEISRFYDETVSGLTNKNDPAAGK